MRPKHLIIPVLACLLMMLSCRPDETTNSDLLVFSIGDSSCNSATLYHRQLSDRVIILKDNENDSIGRSLFVSNESEPSIARMLFNHCDTVIAFDESSSLEVAITSCADRILALRDKANGMCTEVRIPEDESLGASAVKIVIMKNGTSVAVISRHFVRAYDIRSRRWIAHRVPDSIAALRAWGHFSHIMSANSDSILIGLDAGEYGGGLVRIRVMSDSIFEMRTISSRNVTAIHYTSTGQVVVAGAVCHLRQWQTWLGVFESDTVRIVDQQTSLLLDNDTLTPVKSTLNMPSAAGITDVYDSPEGLLLLFPTSGVYRLRRIPKDIANGESLQLIQGFDGDVRNHPFTSGRFIDPRNLVLTVPSIGLFHVRVVDKTRPFIPPLP